MSADYERDLKSLNKQNWELRAEIEQLTADRDLWKDLYRRADRINEQLRAALATAATFTGSQYWFALSDEQEKKE